MQDIKIPVGHGKKTEFEITQLSPVEAKIPEPGEIVKVKFDKFVQLVATHDFEEVMKRHEGEDIILSTNLLTDLANAHEEGEEVSSKKVPIFFIVGILLGVFITYYLIRLR